HKQEEQAVDLGVVVVKRPTVKKGAQVAKIPNPRATAATENIKRAARGEQRVDLGLLTAIDLGAGKEAAAKAQNGGERKCEAAAATNEAAAIGGVARKREDLIIVNIDEASGDDEQVAAEYAEDIYKFHKLTKNRTGGVGLISKSHFDLFLAARIKPLPHVGDKLIFECLAARDCLVFAAEMDWSRLVQEGDAKSLIKDILFLRSQFVKVEFVYSRRSGNSTAHRFAQEATRGGRCKTWELVPPPFLLSCLRKESL
ncbi:hypothetical protein Dimus_022815, partial [Dionaea muscipula]